MRTWIEFMEYATARWATTERGASLVEYALLLALIAVVCLAAVTAMGRQPQRELQRDVAPRCSAAEGCAGSAAGSPTAADGDQIQSSSW